MGLGKYILVFFIIFCFIGTAYSAPVGLTSKADVVKPELWSVGGMSLGVGFIFDFVKERKFDIDSGDLETRVYAIRTELDLWDKYNIYFDFGQSKYMEYKYLTQGEYCTSKFDDELAWAVGTNALLYRSKTGVELGAHASLRRVKLHLTEMLIEGVSYVRNNMDSISEDYFQEFQYGLELAWRMDQSYDIPYSLIPYIGLKYSDAEIDADFTVNEIRYNATADNQDLGLFVGLTLVPKIESLPATKRMVINLEARFIDEKAVDVEMLYRF